MLVPLLCPAAPSQRRRVGMLTLNGAAGEVNHFKARLHCLILHCLTGEANHFKVKSTYSEYSPFHFPLCVLSDRVSRIGSRLGRSDLGRRM